MSFCLFGIVVRDYDRAGIVVRDCDCAGIVVWDYDRAACSVDVGYFVFSFVCHGVSVSETGFLVIVSLSLSCW